MCEESASSLWHKYHDLRALSIDALQTNQKAWLRIPSPVLYRLEDRILDVFYAEWVSRPSAELMSPGYLDLLPEMETKADPISALNLAVEAFALANAGNLMSYNGTLETGYCEAHDQLQVVFMVREPLRLHNNAIEYLLAGRGTEQIQSEVGLALYRMTNHRLQVRQLGLGLEPLLVKLACVDMLELSMSRYSFSKMQLGAQQILTMARDLCSLHWKDLSLLIFKIQVQLDEYEPWKACLPESWVPKRIQLAEHRIGAYLLLEIVTCRPDQV
ncbi:hypothetical protein FMUND_8525 [Fusarium mundagurra]|uniref:Uncharacterized protein n=1 Tax=Fusarium mundagurra TaxID=1567541 RepID=A0A8H5YGX0_9HYPO|nr:hypothetical protein FMUND_8525 [Fusarium mundagurra]